MLVLILVCFITGNTEGYPIADTLNIPHKLCAKLDIQGTQLKVEAWYDNDVPADNAKVILLQQQKTLQEATTDERGMCSLAVPPPGDYLLDINAGGGHRTEIAFTIAAEVDVTAGDSKSGIHNKRWWGATVGILLIIIATVLARRVLK